MKKSFIALAVAGAVAAPMTANAVDVVYSGTVGVNLMFNDTASKGKTPTTDKGAHIAADDVRFGVSATEDVGFAQAFGSLRLDLDALSENALSDVDSVAVGLKGAFGTVTLGEATDYSEKGQLANDLILGSDKGAVGVTSATASDTDAAQALGTPNASLSYGLPSVAPGLTAGINLITTTYSANTLSGIDYTGLDDVKEGVGFGAAYEIALGEAGALTVGFGTNSATTTRRIVSNGDSVKDYGSSEAKYQSIGAKYSIAGVSLAIAQQSITGQESTVNAIYAVPVGATNKAVEYEDVTSTDIQLGYDAGPISAYLATSTAANTYNGLGDEENSFDQGLETKSTRIHVAYKVSDNATVHVRNNKTSATGKKNATTDYADIDGSNTRIGMSLSF